MKKGLLSTILMALAIILPQKFWAQEQYNAIETPLTIEAVSGTVTVTINNYYCSNTPTVQYSVDGGPWTDFTLSNTECYGSPHYANAIPTGQIIQLRADSWVYTLGPHNDGLDIQCDADCYVYGNVLSLSRKDYATNYETASSFRYLFYNNTHIMNHPDKELVLPSTKLSDRCYQSMFQGCTGLTSAPVLPATNLDAEECYRDMFKGCSNLNSVTCYATSITGADATKDWLANVAQTGTFTKNADMTGWESGSSGIPEGWNILEVLFDVVTEPYAVLSDNNTVLTFYYDQNKDAHKESMGVGPFDNNLTMGWSENLENIQRVVFDSSFAGCTTLTSTAYWFDNMINLTEIEGLGYLNVQNVTNMRMMFMGCRNLKSLDLSNFNTANVTDMRWMFQDCTELVTIFAGQGWSTSKVSDGNAMFNRCTNLVGGAGTTYSEDHTDYTYAHIDGGTANPGYFTRKGAEPIVVSLVNNGDMEGNDVSSYFVKIHAGDIVPATISNGVGVNESRGIKVEATAMEAEAWDNQFWFRLNQPVSEGTKFRVSYDYRADKEGTIQTEAHEEPGTFIQMTIHGDNYDDVRYFSTEWQRFTYEGTMSSGNSSDQHPMQSVAFSLNHIEEANNYYFDNIVFDVYLEDQCPKPTFKQTDNSVILQSPFDATIYFTLDGSTPTTNSEHANGAIALNLSRSTTIKAIAIVDGYEVSPVATYAFEPTEDNLDQRREELMDMIYWLIAEDSECRQLLDGMKDADPQWMESMIKRLDQVEYEIVEVRDRIETATSNEELDECQDRIYMIANELDVIRQDIDSFAPKPITAGFDGLTAWVSDSASLDDAFVGTGGGREAAAQTIAAIIWNCQYPLTADMLQGISNPNLLVYVTDASLAPEGVQNVVVNGQAQEIILTDATTGNNNFYCPEPFRAQRISYTRNFQQHTVIGTSRGWEGLTLPFPVQTITHATQGQITPFRNDGSNKHFWLRQMRDNGLTYAQTIEPNVPYLIAMPNSTEYYSEFNLSGRVTFSAENTEVYSSENKQQVGTNEIILIPTFTRVAASDDVYALNVGNARDGYAEGSVFIRNSREVRPFEVYTNHMRVGGARPRFIPVNATTNNETVGIKDIEHSTMNNEQWYSVDGRQLQGEPKTKGVYIQKGKKVVR